MLPVKQILFAIVCALQTAFCLAQPTVWKVQSNKPLQSILMQVEMEIAENIASLTQQNLQLDIRSKEGFVNLREAFTALRLGKIDAMFMSPQYWSGADPVFPIMGDLVAAWDSPDQYHEWLSEHGGIKYLETTYQKYGLKLVGYLVAPTESLVSSVPIANAEDIKGQTVRTPLGMVTDLFQMLGAKTRNIDFLKTDEAFNNGKITIADLSHLAFNNELGLYQKSKHTNFPGFHSTPLYDFVVNQKAWDALTENQQQAIKKALAQWREITYRSYHKKQEEVLFSLSQQQVHIYRWDDQEIKRVRQLSISIWDKYAAKSEKATKLMNEIKQWLKIKGNID